MYLLLDTGGLPACLYCHVGGNKSIVPHLAEMSKFSLGNEVSHPSSTSLRYKKPTRNLRAEA